MPTWSAMVPTRGGPPRKAAYPIELTTASRAAECCSSSPAAVIPSGNPSEAPRPQSTAPAKAPYVVGEVTTARTPATTRTAVTRSVVTRPSRAVAVPPRSRPAVIAETKTA